MSTEKKQRKPASTTPKSRRRTTSPKQSPKAKEPEVVPVATEPRLLLRYRNETKPRLLEEFGYANPMRIPKLEKIVLNIGLGEALQNPRAIENAVRDLTRISGQKPVVTRARKSIAGFKLREGQAIGVMVTLRGARMYEFYDRLVNAALPRIRDFRGISRNSFDGRGNFSTGIREQVIFPEIDYDSIDRMRGLQVVMVTSAKNDHEAMRLLELLGMPFVRESTPNTRAS